jgi:LacI family transcriptional regulator
MEYPPRIIVSFDVGRVWARDLVRGVAAYAEMYGPWDCDYLLDGPCTMQTISRGASADGIITMCREPEIARALERLKVPIVVPSGNCRLPQVFVDPDAIGRMGAEHLFERGFRRFATYLGEGPAGTEFRTVAFAKKIRSLGLPCEEYESPPLRRSSSWRANQASLKSWLENLKKPVGIFCTRDEVARELATACTDASILVPDEVGIVGVNNDDFLCQLSKPTLSSVDIGPQRLGFESARLLDQIIHGKKANRKPILLSPMRVVVRDSSDTVAADSEHVMSAVRYIHDHLAEGVSVKELVQHLPMSRRTLELEFRRHLNRTVHEEIVRAQLHRAACLLEDSNLPISAVATQCGFKRQSRLSILFKEKTSQTPLEYRRVRQRKSF